MRRVVFVDLDDTLFHTRHKTGAHASLVAVAFTSDGAPASFMNERQRAFYDWIAHGADVVPTTGRNAAAYRRVSLPFGGWAICSFGGLVLRPDGTADPDWRARMAALVEPDTLASLAGVVRGEGIRVRIVEDDGLPLYLSIKCAVGDNARLGPVRDAMTGAAPPGWQIHLNGHNLSVLPPFLGKEHAVRWYRANVAGEDALAIGVGDSLSDAPFLAACDFAVAPSQSQLLLELLP